MVTTATKSAPSTKSASASATALQQADSAREQILSTIRQSKQFALEAATTWVDVVGKAVPSLPPIPGVPTQSDLRKAFAMGFGFVEELLAVQREFAEDLLAALPDSPLTPASEPSLSAS